jgi:hypothetical protein
MDQKSTVGIFDLPYYQADSERGPLLHWKSYSGNRWSLQKVGHDLS